MDLTRSSDHLNQSNTCDLTRYLTRVTQGESICFTPATAGYTISRLSNGWHPQTRGLKQGHQSGSLEEIKRIMEDNLLKTEKDILFATIDENNPRNIRIYRKPVAKTISAVPNYELARIMDARGIM